MPRITKLALILPVVALLVSCGNATTDEGSGSAGAGSSGPERPGSTIGSRPTLDGRSFTSTAITKGGTPTTLLPSADGQPGVATISFQPGGKLMANGGCNSLGGPYQLDGTTLVVEQGISTLIGCDPPIQEQGQWFNQFVSSRPTLVLEGETLTLSRDSTVIVFTDRKITDPDRSLVGPTWSVDTIFGSGGTASSTVGPKPTVVFGGDGTVTYDDSCAGGRAKWKRNGDQITFSERGANPTAVACPPSDSREEAALQKTLNGTWTWKIDGTRLDITRGDEGIGLQADATPQSAPVTR